MRGRTKEKRADGKKHAPAQREAHEERNGGAMKRDVATGKRRRAPLESGELKCQRSGS